MPFKIEPKTPFEQSIANECAKFVARSLTQHVEDLSIKEVRQYTSTKGTFALVDYPVDGKTQTKAVKYQRETPLSYFERTFKTITVDHQDESVNAFVLPGASNHPIETILKESPITLGGTSFDYPDTDETGLVISESDKGNGLVEVTIKVNDGCVEWLKSNDTFYVMRRIGSLTNPENDVGQPGRLKYFRLDNANLATLNVEISNLVSMNKLRSLSFGLMTIDGDIEDLMRHPDNAVIRVTNNGIQVKMQGYKEVIPYELPFDLNNLTLGYYTDVANMGEPLDMPTGILSISNSGQAMHRSSFLHVPQVCQGMIGFIMVEVMSGEVLAEEDLLVTTGVDSSARFNNGDMDIRAPIVRHKKLCALSDSWLTSLVHDRRDTELVDVLIRNRTEGGELAIANVITRPEARRRYTHQGYLFRGRSERKSRLRLDRMDFETVFEGAFEKNDQGHYILPNVTDNTHTDFRQRLVAIINSGNPETYLQIRDLEALYELPINQAFIVGANEYSANYVGQVSVVVAPVSTIPS